jgi:hypothetical protein
LASSLSLSLALSKQREVFLGKRVVTARYPERDRATTPA